jgi:hypothetical protein
LILQVDSVPCPPARIPACSGGECCFVVDFLIFAGFIVVIVTPTIVATMLRAKSHKDEL